MDCFQLNSVVSQQLSQHICTQVLIAVATETELV